MNNLEISNKYWNNSFNNWISNFNQKKIIFLVIILKLTLDLDNIISYFIQKLTNYALKIYNMIIILDIKNS